MTSEENQSVIMNETPEATEATETKTLELNVTPELVQATYRLFHKRRVENLKLRMLHLASKGNNYMFIESDDWVAIRILEKEGFTFKQMDTRNNPHIQLQFIHDDEEEPNQA